MKDRQPAGEVADALEIGTQQLPILGSRRSGKTLADGIEIERVQEPGIDQLDLVQVEMGRRPAEVVEVEIGRELVEVGRRFDRLRRSDPG